MSQNDLVTHYFKTLQHFHVKAIKFTQNHLSRIYTPTIKSIGKVIKAQTKE